LNAGKRPDEEVFTLVLDFKDAFMSIPLHPDEQRFNCANAGFVVRRSREALMEGEPSEGTFVIWRTLGFGGKPNPLVFSRVASFASRSAQALLGSVSDPVQTTAPAPGNLQLYVDDPVVSVRSRQAEAHETLDLVIAWWLVLGIPLSWKKGSLTDGSVPHRWIGIDYTLSDEGAIMRLPPQFIKDLLTLIEPLCVPVGTITRAQLDVVCGKAARVAHVVPSAKPFVSGLWGALNGAEGNLVPRRRFCHAAAWIRALLTESEDCPLSLERLVGPHPPSIPSVNGWTIEFDASIYGGGAVLRNSEKQVKEYFSVIWCDEDALHLDVVKADTRFQSFWEFTTLFLALVTWGDWFVDAPVLIVGDNTAALTDSLSLGGKGVMQAVSREISWRVARRRWKYMVGHLPAEHNLVADALSRQADPKSSRPLWPDAALASADFVSPPRLRDLWLARPK